MSSARSPLSDLQRKPVTSSSQTKGMSSSAMKEVEGSCSKVPVEETTINMLIIETPEREKHHHHHHQDGAEKQHYMGGAAGVAALIVWALVIFAAAYLLFYFFRPWFVLVDPNNPNSPIDTGKILLASFIVALIALIIIWLIKMAVGGRK